MTTSTREHVHDLRPFTHGHHFGDEAAPRRERALWWVTWITLATMLLELGVGYWSGSLALVADGWHMGTHALALGGAALAAHYSRRVAGSSRFAFGGWKIEVLSAYTSGLLLLAMGLWIGIDAVLALSAPRRVAYGEAMVVAVVGLAINLACAAILARAGGGHAHPGHAEEPAHGDGHDHHHGSHEHDHTHDPKPDHGHRHGHGHHDHNFSAAYLHVIADAFTSLLAIAALAGGLWWGIGWLDPLVALIGAVVIGRWAVIVLRGSAGALVDASAPPRLATHIRQRIEADGDAKVADLHLWQVGPGAYAAIVSLVADVPLAPQDYQARLSAVDGLAHVTVETHRCVGARH